MCSVIQLLVGEGQEAGRKEDMKDGDSHSQLDKLENSQQVRAFRELCL